VAHNKIFFEHPTTQVSKEAPVGFSWTLLAFGIFVPIFRGHWRWAFILFMAHLILMIVASILFTGRANAAEMTQVAPSLIDIPMAFYYNSIYIRELVETGYKAKAILKGNVEAVSHQLKFEIPEINSAPSIKWKA